MKTTQTVVLVDRRSAYVDPSWWNDILGHLLKKRQVIFSTTVRPRFCGLVPLPSDTADSLKCIIEICRCNAVHRVSFNICSRWPWYHLAELSHAPLWLIGELIERKRVEDAALLHCFAGATEAKPNRLVRYSFCLTSFFVMQADPWHEMMR